MKNVPLNIPFMKKVRNFVNGDIYTAPVEHKNIYNTLISDDYYYDTEELEHLSYEECVKKVKRVLNLSRKVFFANTLIIETPKNIDLEPNLYSDLHLLVLVRIVNFTFKGRYFIILNDRLIYIPNYISGEYSERDIYNIVNNILKSYKFHERRKLLYEKIIKNFIKIFGIKKF